jgi:hypothetical protein
MARARSIKPGFFSNEDLIELPFEYRLLFAGLWTLADRDGRMEDRPKRVKLNIFPGDDVDCEAGLAALAEKKFIQRYKVDGIAFIQIVAWKKHQSPHIKEAASTIPAPDSTGADTSVAALTPSSLTPSSLTPDCGLLTPDCGSTGMAPNGHEREMTPEGAMAIALRDLGVSVRSTDPVLHSWLRAGFTVQQATDAVGIARIRKPHPEVIPPNYLDRILRAPQRAPPERLTKHERARRALGETEDVGFG